MEYIRETYARKIWLEELFYATILMFECGIAAGSFGYKLHIELHTGVKASVNHACQTETDDNKLRANAASGLKKKYSPTY